jgi:LacI family transcriptional regulator
MSSQNTTPTMKDVAREAGVALGTVSKVINGLPVGAAYKAKVDAAVAKLNYRVNSYAKSLKLSRTLTVALIIPNIYNTFFACLAQYVNQELSHRGYTMLLCITDNSLENEQNFADLMRDNRVDGVIALTYSKTLRFSPSIPVVGIDRRFGPGIPCVCSDNYGGGQLAAQRLLALGCRKPLFLSTMTDVATEVAKRKDGFCAECTLRGVHADVCEKLGNADFEALRDFLTGHLRGGRFDYDGVFCVSDSMAYQTCRFLRENGVRIPQDVQVVGYDGIRKFGYLDRFCSTIVQPADKIAKTCVNIVLSEDYAETPELLCLPVQYAPGGTTRDGPADETV